METRKEYLFLVSMSFLADSESYLILFSGEPFSRGDRVQLGAA
jgi:hypothetical protein